MDERATPAAAAHRAAAWAGVAGLCLAAAAPGHGQVVAVWANSGEDKVAREATPASSAPASVHNALWDGQEISLFGARNETVSFAVILEAGAAGASGVSVALSPFIGGGYTLAAAPHGGSPEEIFDFSSRPVELFLVRYLRIRGLSWLSYDWYDERHTPERLRRPWSGQGFANGGMTWADRPDRDRHYPEIALPIEADPIFAIAHHESQTIWVDAWIPRDAPAGVLSAAFTVSIDGTASHTIPVRLEVRDFSLPETPTARTMVYLSDYNLAPRYGHASEGLVDRHFQMAHRHRISLIDDGIDGANNRPPAAWERRLDGSLFTAAHGYAGPGEGIGNGVYSIGTYGAWQNLAGWDPSSEAIMRSRTDAWESWFAGHPSPAVRATERFLYLIDESTDYAQTQQWAAWVRDNPGPGGALPTFATAQATRRLPESHPDDPPIYAHLAMPALSIIASWVGLGVESEWETALAAYRDDPSKRFWLYNGIRPGSGSFATEDDGVSLRQLAWTQWKKRIDRWFFWESTYWNNFQGWMGQTDVWSQAHTFGFNAGPHAIRGESGWNYSNGDGVLFYPGTDLLFPASNRGLPGPVASLRLKHWRRGIQDVEYLALAAAIAPAATAAIVESMVPSVLWENGTAAYRTDPWTWYTWVRCDIGWPTDPDLWEAARSALAEIIAPHAPSNPADLNGDGRVDGSDLGLLLLQWGGSGSGDLDGNGLVDGGDLGLLLLAWTG